MTTARCLCGDVTWALEGRLGLMSHCHCSACRKSHGTAYATYVIGASRRFSLHGEGSIAAWESSPGYVRRFCRRCGAVVPSPPSGDVTFVPAGNFDGDPPARPSMHIFVASKAPWFDLTDSLPRFDEYPPGIDLPSVATRTPLEPPGKPRGSCLCGAVTFVVEGDGRHAWYCHCSRCRRSRSAAFATNLVTAAGGIRFTRGAELVSEFQLPDAHYHFHAFCGVCGSSMPRIDPARGLAVTPMGSLDDAPAMLPESHIFATSKATWDAITDALPQYDAYPPMT
ncbi:MAG TPA: GFA family protein [Polyangiaceae bacterium]|jgi:hypothetical protein|nr:GFA family protein [Polyangiaceae bacterium]